MGSWCGQKRYTVQNVELFLSFCLAQGSALRSSK